jgi:hypothetical protein
MAFLLGLKHFAGAIQLEAIVEAVRRSLGEPDPFRLRYRELIAQIVSTIIRERMN